MLYLIYNASDLEDLKGNLLPLVKGIEFQLVLFPDLGSLKVEPRDYLLTYLDQQHLKEFLLRAAQENWRFGILPHPGNKLFIGSLGLSRDPEKIIAELKQSDEFRKIDLLLCNGTPVFHSVNLGNVFLLKQEESKGFFREIISFLTNIKKLSSLYYQPLQLSIEGEKILHTASLGVIVVDHSLNSVISKRLLSDTATNDGMFYAFIVAPQNLFQLLNFFFRSLLPRKTIKKLPSFIGMVKTPSLRIEYTSEVEFTIDGDPYQSKVIDLEVKAESLFLNQASVYISEKEKNDVKKSLKVDHLPKGEKMNELIKRKLPWLPRATTEEFSELFKVLRDNASSSSSFYIMMILSTILATFGLFGDSSPVIIGAMILAPIISPIVSFSMGMVRYDPVLLKTGITTIVAGTVVSLIFSSGVSLIIPLQVLTSEIENRLSPTLLDMGIAVISGIAAAYAHAKEGIAKSLAGVAIAVALVPPLSVAGIGIGWWDWEVFSGAFLLYLTNLSGIIMFAGLTFLLLGFAPFKTAKKGLVFTLLLTILVMIPLSISFRSMQEKAQLTKKLEGSHFRKVILRDVKIRLGKELMVSVKLVGPESIGSEEMKEIKELIELEIGRPIILEVVSAVEF